MVGTAHTFNFLSEPSKARFHLPPLIVFAVVSWQLLCCHSPAATLEFIVTYSGQDSHTWYWSDGSRDRITLNASGTVRVRPYQATTTDGQSFISNIADLDSTNHISVLAIEDGSVPTQTLNTNVTRLFSLHPSSTYSHFSPEGYVYFETRDSVFAPSDDITVYACEYVATSQKIRIWVALPDPFYYPSESYEHYDFPATHITANQSVAHSSLIGTVLDPQGTGISRAQVSFGGVSRTSDAQGNFQYDDIPPANYSLRIKKEGFLDLSSTEAIPAFSILQRSYSMVSTLPIPSFTIAPTDHPVAGDVVTFDASASRTAQTSGRIVNFAWDFESDGIVDAHGGTEAAVVQHSFTSRVGVFKVRLTVTDDGGLSASIQKDVTVQVCDDRPDRLRQWEIPILPVTKLTGDGPLGPPFVSDAGQSLQLYWRNPGPDAYYELVFTGVAGSPSGRIGGCKWVGGVNAAFVWGPDRNGNGKPDFFRRTHWTSIDAGSDDDNDGMLDVWFFGYDVCANKFTRHWCKFQYRCLCSSTASA